LFLLGYSSEHKLTDLQSKIRILNLCHFLTAEIRLTLHAFRNQQYYKFDAQVGENLCQIRAVHVLDMHINSQYNSVNRDKLTDTITLLDDLLLRLVRIKNDYQKILDYQGNIKQHVILLNFLKQHEL